jgi:hypothetical protein
VVSRTIALVADGSSDRCLIHPIRWAVSELLRLKGEEGTVQYAFASLPAGSLKERVIEALDTNPCEVLLIHRDAEREDPLRRTQEILNAIEGVREEVPKVPIVPVRMSEAWLLIDEQAIRIAAGNPAGTISLDLPRVRDLERVPDPKAVLHESILVASQSAGRRRDRLKRDLSMRVQRVAQVIEDYSKLRSLAAFQRFESDLVTAFEAESK